FDFDSAALSNARPRTCRETHIALGYRFDSQSIFSQVYAPWFSTRAPKHRVAMWRQQRGPCDMALSGEPRRGKHPPGRHQFRSRRPGRAVCAPLEGVILHEPLPDVAAAIE